MNDTSGSGAQPRKRKVWRWWLPVIMVAAAVVWIGARSSGQETDAWAAVERRDLVMSVPIEGELEAVDSAMVGPPQVSAMWQYKISFLAPEGKTIEEGQPVLGFDVTELRQNLQRLVAERDSTQKELEKRATDMERTMRQKQMSLAESEARLRKANFALNVPAELIARQELEEARIDQSLATLEIDHLRRELESLETRQKLETGRLEARRDRAAAEVVELEDNIGRMMVAAPRSGTVIMKMDWRNNKMKMGDQVWRGAKVLEIPDLSRMRAEGEVAEADAGRLAVGHSAVLRLDAYPEREYTARVARIRRTVQRKSWRNPVKIVKVMLEIETTDTERMRPGMRFRGDVEFARKASTLVVPVAAVLPAAGGSRVATKTLFGERRVLPTFGERNDEYFEVLSGLSEGDQVRIAGTASSGEGG